MTTFPAERADLSRHRFRTQHRERWRPHAALVVLPAVFPPAGWSFIALGA
jgi:hypothetical protein